MKYVSGKLKGAIWHPNRAISDLQALHQSLELCAFCAKELLMVVGKDIPNPLKVSLASIQLGLCPWRCISRLKRHSREGTSVFHVQQHTWHFQRYDYCQQHILICYITPS
jgi:hypothetical protein